LLNFRETVLFIEMMRRQKFGCSAQINLAYIVEFAPIKQNSQKSASNTLH